MEESRIGVYVCWCGTNIAKMVDVQAVAEMVKELDNVVIARDYKYMCSDPGQEMIIRDIKEHGLNRIVVAACSPRIHELTFRKALENAGLNPYMFQMANIREQVSWVHTDRKMATEKAKDLVRGAIARVNFHEPLDKLEVEINPATLIIGGGITGLSAALMIANAGKKVYLVEKSKSLGGMMGQIDQTYPDLRSTGPLLEDKITSVMGHKNIEVFLDAEVDQVYGYIGNFEMNIRNGSGKEKLLEFGNIIVATGLKPFNPGSIESYGYGKLPDVITSLELENMLKSGSILTSKGLDPEHIAIIHCVGSRNKDYHEYCSRTCCSTALKYANQVRSALPDSKICDLYADMRAYGKGCEEFYTASSGKDILFLMYDQQNELPRITKAGKKDDCKLLITMHEKLSGESVEVPADLVVLMTAMEARDDAKKLARSVGISMCGNGFFIERHPKLDPVATTTDGVYIAGTCQGPKDITESVIQAWAASSRVLASINKGRESVEVTTALVDETICCGCQICVSVCPYTAIAYNEEKNISHVNEILCKGCGTCGSACPTGAIRCRHFTDKQILSQIEGLMSKTIPKTVLTEEE